MTVGQQRDALKFRRGVGCKADPDDYNWVCNICSTENRSWADFCQECEHKAQNS